MAKGIKTGGRQKGTPNKLTAGLKASILEAFQNVGGAEYLTRVAEESPQVFCTLLGKVLPLQVSGEDGGSIKVETIVRRIVDPKRSDAVD